MCDHNRIHHNPVENRDVGVLLHPDKPAAGGGRVRGGILPEEAATGHEQVTEDAGVHGGGTLLFAVRNEVICTDVRSADI